MSRAPALLGAIVACGLLGAAVAQPLFTDDLWWHLGLGRAFAAEGPWLADDPLLFDAPGPPSPAAWLFDLAAFGLLEIGGFHALRIAFGVAVGAILALGGSLLRRAGGSLSVASVGLFVWIALSTYRFAQLRPHLASLALAPLLFRLLLEDGRVPSWRRAAAATALFALWANLHPGFPVGLLLLGAAVTAGFAAAWLGGAREDLRRARRLAICLGLGLVATLANPLGSGSHAAWFAAGADTPELARVMDEWVPADPLSWPQLALPPTPVAWALLWALWLACAALLPRVAAELRRGPQAGRLDPTWLGVALASLIGMTLAVRFLWLGLFPLLLLARAWATRERAPSPALKTSLALLPLLGCVAYATVGDWPLVTRGLPTRADGWAEPYAARKYSTRPIWLLRDAGVGGRLYCDYFEGGFAGWWLAPGIRTAVNGSLNVPADRVAELSAIARREGLRPGESFTELLDRLGIDVFLGIRLPETGNPHRPWSSTTTHLEDTPGWIPVFRSLDSALYLRDLPRNRENLERLAAYYAERGVPFDAERGFDPLAALRAAPVWAFAQGLGPRRFAQMERVVEARPRVRERVAATYLMLGRYDEAARLERWALARRPNDARARRRLVWSLLRLGRFEEAEALAPELAERPASDPLSRAIALAAVEVSALPDEEARARLVRLPAFYRRELPRLIAGRAPPVARVD